MLPFEEAEKIQKKEEEEEGDLVEDLKGWNGESIIYLTS